MPGCMGLSTNTLTTSPLALICTTQTCAWLGVAASGTAATFVVTPSAPAAPERPPYHINKPSTAHHTQARVASFIGDLPMHFSPTGGRVRSREDLTPGIQRQPPPRGGVERGSSVEAAPSRRGYQES